LTDIGNEDFNCYHNDTLRRRSKF